LNYTGDESVLYLYGCCQVRFARRLLKLKKIISITRYIRGDTFTSGVIVLKCPICGTENPGINQFCSNCGKPVPKQQVSAKTVPSGAMQNPVPPASKGSGPGLFLLIGGLLFLLLIIGMGIVFIAVMPGDDPGISSGGRTPQGPGTSGDYGQTADPSGTRDSGSVINPESTLPVTAGSIISPPVQGSSTPSNDSIVGMWEIGSTGMQMQFDEGGVASLRDTATGYHSTGSWEKISDGRYRLRSAEGTESPVLISDPLAGILYFEDYSTVFIRKS
jgi:hypothetical protein